MANLMMTAVAEHMKTLNMKFAVGMVDGTEQNIIKTGYGGLDNVGTLETVLRFDDNNRYVELVTVNYSTVPEGKFDQVIRQLNKLNKQYRWVTFYADEDNNRISAKLSAILDPKNAGAQAVELLQRLTGICNKAYPDIMQSMWS